jgi:siroheme decarboxylase
MSRKPEKENRLSAPDKRILNRLQDGIPFERKPWEVIAKELDTEEGLLLSRITFLKKAGIIRRISAVFSPRKVDFVSTLVAVKTASGKIGTTAKRINRYPEVTHNYRRSGPYDLWFTLVAGDRGRIARIIRRLKKDKDIKKISEFPAVKFFKINVNFRV